MHKSRNEEAGVGLRAVLSVAATSAILSACSSPKGISHACEHAKQTLGEGQALAVMPDTRSGIAHVVVDSGGDITIESQRVINDVTKAVISRTMFPIASRVEVYNENYEGVEDTVTVSVDATNPQYPTATVETCPSKHSSIRT